jgi:hypothetical protein
VKVCFWSWNDEGDSDNNKTTNSTNAMSGTRPNRTGAVCWPNRKNYKLWVWGHAWPANYWFTGVGKVSGKWTCEHASYAEEREFLDASKELASEG